MEEKLVDKVEPSDTTIQSRLMRLERQQIETYNRLVRIVEALDGLTRITGLLTERMK